MILRSISATVLLSFACALAAGAQTTGAPGCGAPEQKFDVKTIKEKAEVKAVPGKALLLVLQNDSLYGTVPRPTNRIGVDGKWVGATHGKSYLTVVLEPGEHHLCTSWQTSSVLWHERSSAAAHFTADPNGIYYFQVKDLLISSGPGGVSEVVLEPVDSDEGQLMMSEYKQAQSKIKALP